jgi:hypothetical protein
MPASACENTSQLTQMALSWNLDGGKMPQKNVAGGGRVSENIAFLLNKKLIRICSSRRR